MAEGRGAVLAASRDIRCGVCGHSYCVDVPIIIDVSRAPDVVARLAAGELYRVVCPACGEVFGELDAACVLVGLGPAAPVIVSPPATTSDEELDDVIVALVLATQEWLGDDWDDAMFDRALVTREVLTAMLLPRAAAAPELVAAVSAFASVGWHRRAEIIAREPALLDDSAAELLTAAVTTAQERGDSVAAEDLRALLNILTRCRQLGVDAVLPADLGAALDELQQGPPPARQVELALVALGLIGGSVEHRLLREDLLDVLAAGLMDDTGTNRAGNIDQAIELLLGAERSTWRSRELFPQEWAARQKLLGTAYLNRVKGERRHNLERALVHLRNAAEVLDRDESPEDWAHLHILLAGILSDSTEGNTGEDVEEALHHARAALTVVTPGREPMLWHDAQRMMARALLRLLGGVRVGNVAEALTRLEEVVAAADVLPAETRAQVQLELAGHLIDLAADDDGGRLTLAVAQAEAARAVLEAADEPVFVATADHLLGWAFAERGRLTGSDADLAEAAACFRRALAVRTVQYSPMESWETHQGLARLHFDKGEWEDAVAVYTAALPAGEEMLGAAYTEGGRLAVATKLAVAYAEAAYCLVHLDRYGAALQWLEGGRARVLAERLLVDDADLTSLDTDLRAQLIETRRAERMLEAELRAPSEVPDRACDDVLADRLRRERRRAAVLFHTALVDHPELETLATVPELLAGIPPGGAAVVPFATYQGSAMFVLRHGATSIGEEDVLFGDSRAGDWHGLVAAWTGAYRAWQGGGPRDAWMTAVDDVTCGLWDSAIAERLGQMGIGPGASVVIVPHSGLGSLPLHAAWREVAGARRALLDDFTVSFAPSLAVLAAARRRRHRRSGAGEVQSALVVANPTGDLPFTEPEAEAVARRFPASAGRLLAGPQATQAGIVEAGRGATHLHFACHGVHDRDDPMESGLVLSGGDVLTVREIATRLDLESAQVVVLSACDTGLGEGTTASEEYVGLPGAFLSAGAATVVSSLWAVGDLSTMLLMERFYQRHLAGLDPASALREAQVWLRDATAGELTARFAEERARSARWAWRLFAVKEVDDRPFAHPFHWAAFTCAGA